MAKPSDKSNSKSHTVSYYLPMTRLRLRCKIIETPHIKDSDKFGLELTISDISIESERIADTSKQYLIDIQKDTILHRRGIALEFTETGTLSAGTLSLQDRLGPLIMKGLTFLPSLFISFKQFEKQVKGNRAVSELDDNLKILLRIRKDIEELQTELYSTASKKEKGQNELRVQQELIRTLREQIAVLSEMYALVTSALAKEYAVEKILLPVLNKSEHSQSDETAPVEKGTKNPALYKWKWVETLGDSSLKPTLVVEMSGFLPNAKEAETDPSGDPENKSIYYRTPLELRADAWIKVNKDIPIFTNRRFVFAHLGGTKCIAGKSDLFKSEDITVEYHPTTSGLKKIGRTTSGGLAETVLSAGSSIVEAIPKETDGTSGILTLKADSDLLQAKIDNLKKKVEREALILSLKEHNKKPES